MTDERFAATLREFTNKPDKGRILVFEEGQSVVGYAILVFFYSNEYGGDIVDIDELYVTESARGRGVAGKFFEWLQKEWSGRAVALSLQTTRGNAGAARLYERLGFTQHANIHYLALLPRDQG